MRAILIRAVFWTDQPLGRGLAREPLGSGSAFVLALFLFGVARKQDGADAVQVGNYGDSLRNALIAAGAEARGEQEVTGRHAGRRAGVYHCPSQDAAGLPASSVP